MTEKRKRGEPARLFPVLAETSKEGRTLSIFLACLENVHEFRKSLLSDLNVKIGTRARVETYTEVVLEKGNGKKDLRPDGLIVVQTGSNEWCALVEAKVGKNDLEEDQVNGYLDIAKLNGVDALITISNQFAPLPAHYPLHISAGARKKAELYHWSWMYILTQAKLLLDNNEIQDKEQSVILNEMVRFLSHESAGVKSFDQMPPSWSDAVTAVQAGGALAVTSEDTREVVGAWHQEVRDLSLILSRQIGQSVKIRAQRDHQNDPVARLKSQVQAFCREKCLTATLSVPNAAAPIEIVADLQTRSVVLSMRLKAPTDKKSTKARTNWLLRQLHKSADKNIHIRLFWPGRGPYTQHTLKEVRDNPDLIGVGQNATVSSFEILMVRDCGARFGQRKNFIVDLEATASEFYEQVGQYLRAWQAPAPRLREEKSEPASVDTKALREEAEAVALGVTEDVIDTED